MTTDDKKASGFFSCKKLNENTKFSLFMMITMFLFLSSFIITTTAGWHIPSPEEIHYDEGVVKVIKIPKSKKGTVDHIEITTKDGKYLHLSCSYAPYHYSQYSDCDYYTSSQELTKNVHNKIGVAGWYIQKPFFGIKNPYPQIVSLTIDGKHIEGLSYHHRISKMHQERKRLPIVIMICFVVFVMAFIWIERGINPRQKF